MLPNLTNQYISYSMAVFSANEIRTFLFRERADALFIGKLLEYYIFLNEVWKIGAQHSMQNLYEEL